MLEHSLFISLEANINFGDGIILATNLKECAQRFGKLNTLLNKVPQLEQGIFFSKSLYFSVGGLGEISSNPFAELSKRFYLRLDPQNPLPSLTIRAKSLLN